MKWTTLLVALFLFATIAMRPFMPAPPKEMSGCVLEIEVASARSGTSELTWERGNGLEPNPQGPVAVASAADSAPVKLVFTLPPGALPFLRFDPIDQPGDCAFGPARVKDPSGRVLREFPAESFHPANDALDLRLENGFLHFRSVIGDPYFSLTTHGLFLPALPRIWTKQIDVWSISVGVVFFLATLIGLVAVSPTTGPKPWVKSFVHGMARRPVAGVAFFALLSAIASSYPLVFLGKSLVSPNFGTPWLYRDFPTVAGATDGKLSRNSGSDVGAMAWSVLPTTAVERHAIGSGALPLWNRYNAAGNPLLAQGQSMFGDPFQWLTIAAQSASWAWDLRLVLAKFLLACGVGVSVWLVTSRFLPAAAIALSAPFIGFFLYRINHPATFSLGYSPWVLVGWLMLAQAPLSRRFGLALAVWLAANSSLILSGTVKEAYFLCLGLNLAGAIYFLFTPVPASVRSRKIIAITVAGLGIALLAAPVWLNFLACLRTSATAYDTPLALQTPPYLALGFFDEIFYRQATPGEQSFCPSLNFFILIGFLWWLASLRETKVSRESRALGWIAAVAAALVFGLVPARVITATPFLGNVIHISNTFSCLLVILTLVLSGVGWSRAFDRLALGHHVGEAPRAFGWLALFAGIFFATAQAHSGIPNESALSFSPFFKGYASTLFVAVILLPFAAHRALRPGWWTPASWVVFALCFVLLHWRMGLQPTNVFPQYTVTPPPRVSFHQPSAGMAWLQARQAVEDPFRVAGLDHNLTAGVSGFYQLEGISGPDALTNSAYEELAEAAESAQKSNWNWGIDANGWEKHGSFYDLLNTRYFVAREAIAATSNLELVHRADDFFIYRSQSAWPRAFFTNEVATYELPSELAAFARDGDHRPFAAGQRSASLAWGLLPGARPSSGRVVTSATSYRLEPNATEFVIDASGTGVAVLTETARVGDFVATVDGQPTSWFIINHAFKGVPVTSAGQHVIRFTYRPRFWYWSLGLAIAGAAALLVVLLAVWGKPSPLRKYLAGTNPAQGNPLSA